LYLGKAGQFVVMSEFLVKGWNVAIPEVDIGDDILSLKTKMEIFLEFKLKQLLERKQIMAFLHNLIYQSLSSKRYSYPTYFMCLR